MIKRGLCGIRQKGAILKSFVSTVRHVFAYRCFCLHTLNEQDIDVSYLDQDNVPDHPLCWSGRESVGLSVPGLLPRRQSQPVNINRIVEILLKKKIVMMIIVIMKVK